MRNGIPRRKVNAKTGGVCLPAKVSVGAAVFFALYGVPHPASAQQATTNKQSQAESPPIALQEVIVTANRREQTLEEVPYNLSVVSSNELARGGVTDLPSLAAQVPGLSQFDFGARSADATTPIIRGLNATGAQIAGRAFRVFEQSPVGTYIGNAPIEDGYFQFDDVQRVEVLRGPQGTLYGAGALGGALRIIPNAPELNTFSGRVDVSGGSVAHASNSSYTTSALFNLPVGDTLALRVSGKYAFEPGFVNAYGILERPGPPLTGVPTLADPADPVNSPGVFTSNNNWGDQNTFTGRASLLWKPSENFRADLTFLYANLNGNGSPVANPTYPGGADPIDPRVTLPAGGDYQTFSRIDQPYRRRTSLTSLDMSYDVGFATLSATSSYSKTDGSTTNDASSIAAAAIFAPFYAGLPTNPRYVGVVLFDDASHTFTQEVRLVSNTAKGSALDYVIGVFYERQEREGSWNSTNPGTYQRAVAQGCTGIYFFSAFPNCLVANGPNDTYFTQIDNQSFQEKSAYAELSWHFSKAGQVTLGARHFKQEFTDAQSYTDYPFATFIPATPHDAPASKNIWKINPSYEYASDHYVYATWSQGFRRGGANSVPLTGFYQESPLLTQYAPDSVNSYELGFKGRFANGVRYAFDVFDIEWDKPQISATLPTGNLAVYNANTARSRGFEIESSGPLFLDSLSYTVGGAYTDAKLTSNFSLPANNGAGTIVPGLISGTPGEQMPGSPKVSVASTVSYARDVAPGYGVTLSLNGTYRGRVPLELAANGQSVESPGFAIANLWAELRHNSWMLGAYCTNITDRHVTLFPGPASIASPLLSSTQKTLFLPDVVNKPREVGIRIGYSFGTIGK